MKLVFRRSRAGDFHILPGAGVGEMTSCPTCGAPLRYWMGRRAKWKNRLECRPYIPGMPGMNGYCKRYG